MKMKKIICVILVVMLVLTIMPVMSTAAGTEDIVIKVLVEPSLEYDWIFPFFGGYAVVQNGGDGFIGLSGNGKYGLIDKTGKVVIPVIYDSVIGAMMGFIRDPFRDYIAVTSKNGKDYCFLKIVMNDVTWMVLILIYIVCGVQCGKRRKKIEKIYNIVSCISSYHRNVWMCCIRTTTKYCFLK